MVFFLPALAGTIVDRYGFKKSLLACFSIFCLGYLLIGLAGLPAGKPLVAALGGPQTYMILALVITAIGGSLIKPSIVGTVARTTNKETKSLGYSHLLHAGESGWGHRTDSGAAGAREPGHLLRAGDVVPPPACCSALGTLLFFREPPRPGRCTAAQVDGQRAAGHGDGVRESEVHQLPRHLLGLLGDVLADLLCRCRFTPATSCSWRSSS